MRERSNGSTETNAPSGFSPAVQLALAGLALSTIAMCVLHALQPALSPLEEPVSFYVHGDHGWLLTLAMGCFGAAAVVLAYAVRSMPSGHVASRSMVVFGAGMLLAAVMPSDRWFPWEAPPSVSGLVHAAAAVFSPPFLLVSMLTNPPRTGPRARRIKLCFTIGYTTGLVASAAALAVGLAYAGPPPLIGLAERVLALNAVGWLTAVAVTQG